MLAPAPRGSTVLPAGVRPQDQYKPFRDTLTGRAPGHQAEPNFYSVRDDRRYWTGTEGTGRDGRTHTFSQSGRFAHMLVPGGGIAATHRQYTTPDVYGGVGSSLSRTCSAVMVPRSTFLPEDRDSGPRPATAEHVGPGAYSPHQRPITAGAWHTSRRGVPRRSHAFASTLPRTDNFRSASRAGEADPDPLDVSYVSTIAPRGALTPGGGYSFGRDSRFFRREEIVPTPGPGAYDKGPGPFAPNKRARDDQRKLRVRR